MTINNQYGTFLKFYDESNYQGDSWPADADGGYIKGTENRYVDPTQHAKAQLLRDAGKPVGFYDFLHGAASGMSMKDQAIYFCDMCDSMQSDFLMADWESSATPPTEAERDEWAAEVRAYRPTHVNLLYCNRDYWLNKDTESGRIPELFDGVVIANYNGMPGNPGITHPWVGHQYTSNPVDANVFNFPTVEAAFTFFRSRLAQALGDAPAPYVVKFWGVANTDALYLYTPTPYGGDVRALTMAEWESMGTPAPRVLAADTPEWQAVVVRALTMAAPAAPAVEASPAPAAPSQPESAPEIVGTPGPELTDVGAGHPVTPVGPDPAAPTVDAVPMTTPPVTGEPLAKTNVIGHITVGQGSFHQTVTHTVDAKVAVLLAFLTTMITLLIGFVQHLITR